MKFELPHAVAGSVTLVGSPMKFSLTPLKHEIPPPALGQHTQEILQDVLKKTPEQIQALQNSGVV
jgi:formyl-CoA transferase